MVGSDEGETRRRARELALQLTPKEAGDFGVDSIDGAADNAEQAVQRIHQAIEAIQSSIEMDPSVTELVDFVRNSSRGIYRPARVVRSATENENEASGVSPFYGESWGCSSLLPTASPPAEKRAGCRLNWSDTAHDLQIHSRIVTSTDEFSTACSECDWSPSRYNSCPVKRSRRSEPNLKTT